MRNMGVADFLRNVVASQTRRAFLCRKAQIVLPAARPAIRVTPARLRLWILILGGAWSPPSRFFLSMADGRDGGWAMTCPMDWGPPIQQSTEGFTYSESRGGHTIYTLHASKAVQYKSDGHAELHDVSITLYGAQGAPANRIYGNDFDWDPVHGIARAMGEVQIDFQGAATPVRQAA